MVKSIRHWLVVAGVNFGPCLQCMHDTAVPYQVGSQPEDVGDPQVVVGLIAAAGLDEHTDLGGRGIVLQGGDHQSTGELGHLDRTQEKKFITLLTGGGAHTHCKEN